MWMAGEGDGLHWGSDWTPAQHGASSAPCEPHRSQVGKAGPCSVLGVALVPLCWLARWPHTLACCWNSPTAWLSKVALCPLSGYRLLWHWDQCNVFGAAVSCSDKLESNPESSESPAKIAALPGKHFSCAWCFLLIPPFHQVKWRCWVAGAQIAQVTCLLFYRKKGIITFCADFQMREGYEFLYELVVFSRRTSTKLWFLWKFCLHLIWKISDFPAHFGYLRHRNLLWGNHLGSLYIQCPPQDYSSCPKNDVYNLGIPLLTLVGVHTVGLAEHLNR